MSIRRKAGDWVWLAPNSGFVSVSNRLKAQIQPESDFDPAPCFLCEDQKCREWLTLFTEPDPSCNNKRHMLCHVSECQMFDEPQK
jgi:hypothetical protein